MDDKIIQFNEAFARKLDREFRDLVKLVREHTVYLLKQRPDDFSYAFRFHSRYKNLFLEATEKTFADTLGSIAKSFDFFEKEMLKSLNMISNDESLVGNNGRKRIEN